MSACYAESTPSVNSIGPILLSANTISDEVVIDLVTKNIPHWKAACDNSDAEIVILHQRAFGSSPDELFLLSVAIKYAGLKKKSVTVVS